VGPSAADAHLRRSRRDRPLPGVRLSAFEESDGRPRVKPGRTPGVGCRQRPTGRPGEEPSYGDLKSPLEADILSSESTPVANPEGFRDDAKQLSGGGWRWSKALARIRRACAPAVFINYASQWTGSDDHGRISPARRLS